MQYLYETHLHTSESSACAKNTAAEQVRSYKKHGYAGIIVTDHFLNAYTTCPMGWKMSWEEKMNWVTKGYNAAKVEGDKVGLDVFFGWEFTIRGLDFLTYGLGLDFLLAHPELHDWELEEYSALVRKHGGILVQAHPYRYLTHFNPIKPAYIDAVEVHNSSMSEKVNAKAKEFAKKHSLATSAGGDSHNTGYSPGGIILQKKAENIQDIIAAIKSQNLELILS
jgi:hypothetical protein